MRILLSFIAVMLLSGNVYADFPECFSTYEPGDTVVFCHPSNREDSDRYCLCNAGYDYRTDYWVESIENGGCGMVEVFACFPEPIGDYVVFDNGDDTGTWIENHAPGQPVNQYPANNATGIDHTDSTEMIRAIQYNDDENDRFRKAIWQINTGPDFLVAVEEVEKTSQSVQSYIFITEFLLAEGTTYFWRVQYHDNYGPSEWSEITSFTTAGDPSAATENEAGGGDGGCFIATAAYGL